MKLTNLTMKSESNSELLRAQQVTALASRTRWSYLWDADQSWYCTLSLEESWFFPVTLNQSGQLKWPRCTSAPLLGVLVAPGKAQNDSKMIPKWFKMPQMNWSKPVFQEERKPATGGSGGGQPRGGPDSEGWRKWNGRRGRWWKRDGDWKDDEKKGQCRRNLEWWEGWCGQLGYGKDSDTKKEANQDSGLLLLEDSKGTNVKNGNEVTMSRQRKSKTGRCERKSEEI